MMASNTATATRTHCTCKANTFQHALILTNYFHDLCFAAAADSLGPRIQYAVHMSRPVLPSYMQVPA